MRLLRTLGTFTIAAAALWMATPARGAGSFLEPDARMFTLQARLESGQLDNAGRVRALGDGSVIFVSAIEGLGSARTVWRLHEDGRLQRLAWMGRTLLLATESRGTVVAVRSGGRTLERFDLERRRHTTVARLPARADWLTALADGAIVAAAGKHLWWLRRGQVVRRVRFAADIVGLAPWTRTTAAVLSATGDLWRLRSDGARRLVLRGARQWLLSAGIGRVLTATTDETSPSLTMVDASGRTTMLPWAPPAFEGADGTTAAETPWPNPTSMAVASDGSLVMTTAHGVRALVPGSSTRPRVAPVPQPFDGQHISYFVGAAGKLTAELSRAGERRATTTAVVRRGFGLLSLPTALPLDLYDVKLRLDSDTATTSGQTRAGRRTTLTLEEGRSALARFENTDGDEGGGAGTTIDRCRVASPSAVECGHFWLEAWNNIDEEEEYGSTLMPFGIVRAFVDVDGQTHTERQGPSEPPGPAPTLSLAALETQRLRELVATAATSAAGTATAEAWLRIGERTSIALPTQTSDLRPNAPWIVRFTLDAPRARIARAGLRRGDRVRLSMHVTVAAPVEGGIATLRQTTSSVLKP